MITFCKDLGIYCINRGKSSCKHMTDCCKEYCYNLKFYNIFTFSLNANNDYILERTWKIMEGKLLHCLINQHWKTDIKRIRFAARGECLSVKSDIFKVKDIVSYCSKVAFWLPTRAWKDGNMRALIEKELFPLNNLKIQASIDYTRTKKEFNNLLENNWSTMFFNPNDNEMIFDNDLFVKCRKTWNKVYNGKKWVNKPGLCAKCNHCTSTQNHVWLKYHK